MDEDQNTTTAEHVRALIANDERHLQRGGFFGAQTLKAMHAVLQQKLMYPSAEVLAYFLRVIDVVCKPPDINMQVYGEIFQLVQQYYPKLPSEDGKKYAQLISKAVRSKQEVYTFPLFLLLNALTSDEENGFRYYSTSPGEQTAG